MQRSAFNFETRITFNFSVITKKYTNHLLLTIGKIKNNYKKTYQHSYCDAVAIFT